MSEIVVIGINGMELSGKQQELLCRTSLVVASERLAGCVGRMGIPIFPITPLNNAFAAIEKALLQGNVAVLAGGDPLFFGIASRLINHFGRTCVRVYPALSSMQEASARFGIPWDDAVLVSLHGRKSHHVPGLLLSQEKTFVFTDRENSPNAIAQQISAYLDLIGETTLQKQCRLYIAENLGSEDERISSGTLNEIGIRSYSNLNVFCIVVPQEENRARFGLCEDEIAHSRGLITKDEIRAATLHKLRLPEKGIFWDIGGGSGSISIEAALLQPRLTVYCIECNMAEMKNIKANIRRFRCFNSIPVAGRAKDVIHNLPDPDAVFIGGSSGELEEIVTEAASRLAENGRLVVNGVTEKTIAQAPPIMEAAGLAVASSIVEVSRTGPQGPVRFNPITIMVGRK